MFIVIALGVSVCERRFGLLFLNVISLNLALIGAIRNKGEEQWHALNVAGR